MKKLLLSLLPVLFINLQKVSAQQYITDTATSIQEARHHFTVNLPDQISFKVSLMALDDWDANKFSKIITKINKHINYFADSIQKNSTLQNVLYVEESTHADFEKLNFRQIPPITTEMVFKDGNYYNLKNSLDSLFYTSTVPNKQVAKGVSDSLHQNLITITAKSLSDLNTLEIAQIRKAGQQLDSMVNAAKLKYRNYRNPLYSSNSSWSLSSTGAATSSFKAQQPFMGIINNFKLGVGFGAIVFNNSISPTMELNLGYVLKRSQQNATFIGLNYSLFSEIDLRERNNLVGYLPINLEFGTISNNVGLMQRKTSIGYGVMIKTTQQSGIPVRHYLPNMQLNFGISNTLSASLILATQFKKNPEHYVLGVSLKYNL